MIYNVVLTATTVITKVRGSTGECTRISRKDEVQNDCVARITAPARTTGRMGERNFLCHGVNEQGSVSCRVGSGRSLHEKFEDTDIFVADIVINSVTAMHGS